MLDAFLLEKNVFSICADADNGQDLACRRLNG